MGGRHMRTTATCHAYIGFEYINKLVKDSSLNLW